MYYFLFNFKKLNSIKMNMGKRIINRIFISKNWVFKRNYGEDVYEPDYLDSLKPSVPLYDPLNVQIKGYDFPVLENYQKFLHNIATDMDLDVADAWAVPPQEIQISTFKSNSDVINTKTKLKLYERILQLNDITSTQLPVFLRLIKSSIPAGVTVNVMKHEDWHEEVRYVPDKELLELKQQLEEMGGSSIKKK